MSANLHSTFPSRAFYLASLVVLGVTLASPVAGQTTSTWSGGAGNWSDCPPGGNALWNTCPDPPTGLGWPNGNFNAVIDGGPVTATSASIVNLTIGSSGSLVFAPGQPGILDITGTSIVNDGSISLAGSDGLQIEGNTTVTLSGSGSVTLAGNALTGGNGSPTLISQQTIQGFGTLGNGGLAITNQSTINVTGGALNIQPSATGMTNAGTIEVQSGASLDLISGPFKNTGGTIEALSGSSILLQANISGGTLTSTGTGNFTLAPPGSGGGLSGLTNAGTFNVPAGANLNWQGIINNTGVFNFDGTISTTGSAVTLQGAGTVLMNGGQFEASSAISLTNQQLIHGGGQFFEVPLTNAATGIIQADNTSTQLAINGSSTTNAGRLQASGGGTLALNTVVNNSGGIIEALGSSKVIVTNSFNGSINGGVLTTSGTGIIESQNAVLDGTSNVPTNAGKLNVLSGFDLFFQGTVNNTGSISVPGNSCIILNKPSTLTGSGHVVMGPSSCIFGSGLSFTNDSTIEGAGSIGDSNPMPITNGGVIFANQTKPLLIVPDASGFTNAGKLMARAGSTLHIEGLFNNLPVSGVLTGGTYALNGILELQNTIATNAASITLTGAGAEILSDNTGTNALATLSGNATTGTLSLQGGKALSTAVSLTNAGKITVGTGSSLSVGGSYTQTAGTTTLDGTLSAPSGLTINKGTLQGRGTVAAAVTSAATLIAGDSATKAGKLAISGAYTQNSSGILDVAINGTTAGTQYSQLAVTNGVSLKGTLNIKRLSSFVPAMGDVFTILTGSAITGTFATVNGTSINSAEHFQIAYTATTVTLTVDAGP